MAKKRNPKKPKAESKVVKVVTSGHPDIYPDVEIYDTVLGHIEESHPEEFSRLPDVYNTIEQPARVHKSKTHPTSVTLINDAVTSRGGDPLRVVVKKVSNGTALMSSAHFSSSKDQGELLWPIQPVDDAAKTD